MASGSLVARNTLWNVVGLGAPMVAAVVATPSLIQGLGTERFGVLTMAWAVIGYFTLFDLGLGRALTQLAADKLAREREDELPALTWTAIVLMVALGAVGTVLLLALAPWLAGSALKIDPRMREEAVRSFQLLALSLPFVTSTAGLRGLLEAKQRFGVINVIRVPMGLLTFVGPLAVLPFTSSLVAVVAVLVVGRVIAWAVHLWYCFDTVPALRDGVDVRRALVGPLTRFGGWMTASNVASTLMVYLDRFVIGAVISMAAVAYYVTPYEMVSRLGMIPGAMLAVVFPLLATNFARDPRRTMVLMDASVRVVFLIVFPITLVLVTLAREGLLLWVGAEFARESTRVMQWISVGVFVNTMGMVPATGLQGVGRPELTGKLNLAELPFYLVLLWLFLGKFGIEGAALAWVARATVDTVVLFVLAERVGVASRGTLRRTWALAAGSLVVFFVAATLNGAGTKAIFLALALAAFAVVAWRFLLEPEERAQVQRRRAALRARLSGMAPAVALEKDGS